MEITVRQINAHNSAIKKTKSNDCAPAHVEQAVDSWVDDPAQTNW
jgi:hypothetical protein